MLLLRIEKLLLYISVFFTTIIVLLTSFEALSRYIFNIPLLGTYEITEKYIMVVAVFFGFNHCYREGGNIRVDLLWGRLPERLKLKVNYFIQGFSFLFFLSLFGSSIPFLIRNLTDGLVVDKYIIPMAPSYFVVSVSLFFLTLRAFLDFWQVKKGTSGLLKEETSEEVLSV